MEHISALLQQLRQRLAQPFPDAAGFRQISLPVSDACSDDLLAWLATQSTFPQFYWRHRDEQEEVAVCGALRQFSDAAAAQAFIAAHPTARVWGLTAFDGPSCLFLPRLAWQRRDKRASLTLNLFTENAAETADWLATLAPATPIAPLRTTVETVAHYPDAAGWTQMLQQALTAIAAARLEKVVLARCSRLTLAQPLPAPALMAASRRVNHRCYHFMLRFSAGSAFLGSSPERLYLRDGRRLLTEALAGTVANDGDDARAQQLAQWLLDDRKNQHENLLVVDDICQRLQGRVSALDVQPPEVLRLRKVQHLRRRIAGQLQTADDADCLQRLQPTAAVAGLPRQAARAFIAAHEPAARGWYAGCAGYLSAERSEFCVALRSCQIDDDSLQLYAGAGIVSGSDPAQEWQELDNKAAALRSLLQPEPTTAEAAD
ncbi:isochorismate synthase MenF [Serratia rubidaea]|uniref:isochorismate synthase MenF n=1 Tax=Serratia rubidaea TaxID=61652 RepID=UPI002DBD1ED6|nr:isochorismate synthase MenF [Serratia rubidaea]MEB7585380.1 isochorismate synthase MenF [Serratia rubidaea]